MALCSSFTVRATVANLSFHFARSQIADRRLSRRHRFVHLAWICVLQHTCIRETSAHICFSLFFDGGHKWVDTYAVLEKTNVRQCLSLWHSFSDEPEGHRVTRDFVRCSERTRTTLHITDQTLRFVIEMPLCAVSWMKRRCHSRASTPEAWIVLQWWYKPVILIMYACVHCKKLHRACFKDIWQTN